MAKYSTGGSGSAGSGDACELCGREDRNLSRENVAGAELLVCSDCAPHGNGDDNDGRGEDRGEREPNAGRRAAQNAARVHDASTGNPDWVEDGTDYEDDQLPYLVSDYGQRAERARQDAGLTVEELAAELDVTEDEVLAVEQGRAARANVGGSVVASLESFLETELVDE
ncbi:MAG: putative eukaryotic MBF1-like transcription factor [halophilic archaeon J07HB67]|jgi:transcriptional regulator, XRE family|nr:MAG: putative eukaryotic MBF1-like transcription factor [halophilic archaeon J07HB67]